MILNRQKIITKRKRAVPIDKSTNIKLKGKLIKIDMIKCLYFFHKKKNQKNNKGPKQVIKKYIGLIK